VKVRDWRTVQNGKGKIILRDDSVNIDAAKNAGYGDTLLNPFSASVPPRPSSGPRCLSHAKPSSSLRASRFPKARESLRAVGRRPRSNPRAEPLAGGIRSLLSRSSFPVSAEFFPCYGGQASLLRRSSLPVRSAENAVSQPVYRPYGFRMRLGERRSGMLSSLKN